MIKNQIHQGPGNYKPVVQINSDGKCPLSGIPNIKSINFGKSKSKRFLYKYNNVPRPGSYKSKGLFGTNFVSKYNSGNLSSFHQRFKIKSNLDNTPGPGAYSSFSEFGTSTVDKSFKIDRFKIKKKLMLLNKKKKHDENNKSNIIQKE